MQLDKYLLIPLISLLLAACGGGSSSNDENQDPGEGECAIPTQSIGIQELSGTWINSDGVEKFSLVTFFENGTYVQMQVEEEIEVGAQSGMEVGTYTLDEITGQLMSDVSFDKNGEYGFNEIADVYLRVNGDTLTILSGCIDNSPEETFTLEKQVANDGVVGTWSINTSVTELEVLTLLEDGTYVFGQIIPDGQPNAEESGMEWGTYELDDSGFATIAHIFNGNGSIGFTDFVASITDLYITVSDDSLSLFLDIDEDKNGSIDETVEFIREFADDTPQVSNPLDFLRSEITGQTFYLIIDENVIGEECGDPNVLEVIVDTISFTDDEYSLLFCGTELETGTWDIVDGDIQTNIPGGGVEFIRRENLNPDNGDWSLCVGNFDPSVACPVDSLITTFFNELEASNYASSL